MSQLAPLDLDNGEDDTVSVRSDQDLKGEFKIWNLFFRMNEEFLFLVHYQLLNVTVYHRKWCSLVQLNVKELT